MDSEFDHVVRKRNFSFSLKTNNNNVNVSLSVIGNGGGEGNPRCLLLNYHGRYFMFNCGEGVQRILLDLFGYKKNIFVY